MPQAGKFVCSSERFPRRAGGGQRPLALLRDKGGILFPKRIPPLNPPEKGEGRPPSTPALAVGRLKSCAACGIRCLPSVAARRFGLLLLPAAALPAIRQSYAISVYFGCYQSCRCLPRRHCCARRVVAPSVEGDSSAPTQDQQSDSGDRSKSNRIAPPMAASEAMPPRRALSFPRRRTPSSCKLAMEFSLGGLKGGVSLFQKEIPLPCPCSAIGAAIPHMVWGRHYSDNKIRSLSSSCPAPALKRAMRSSTPIPARSLPATSSTICPSAIISVRLPSSSA